MVSDDEEPAGVGLRHRGKASILGSKLSRTLTAEGVVAGRRLMPQKPFAPVVTRAKVLRFAPDEEAGPHQFEPGDFILTHGKSWTSWLIRFGQSLRFWGASRRYAWWSHAAMIVAPDGALVEALGAGVTRTHISKYRPAEYHLVSISDIIAAPVDRNEAVAFAEWCVGMPYAWLVIVSIAISLVTGGKFTFGFDGQAICSGLVARGLERTKAIFNRTPSHIMPADLAMYFQVER